jgi:hypothetical protein
MSASIKMAAMSLGYIICEPFCIFDIAKGRFYRISFFQPYYVVMQNHSTGEREGRPSIQHNLVSLTSFAY